MVHNFPTTDRPVRIPPIAWFLGLGLLIALVAIFMFNVPLGTVGYVAFIAFFIGSHFFMHGSHSRHGGNEQRTDVQTNVDGPSGAAQSTPNEQARHSGGCH